MKHILGIIPARYASTRFPGKPLTDIGGKSMVRRVYEQVSKSHVLTKVVVATDDKRIAEHVESWGGSVIMTRATHQSGTDRCAEVLQKQENHYDIVLNIQGDEPFIDPAQIDLLVSCFDYRNVEIATLCKVITEIQDLDNPHVVKTVFTKDFKALYFSRYSIPYCRGISDLDFLSEGKFYKHIGIYGFKPSILQEITGLNQSTLESAESLEQLRWLENGYQIHVGVTEMETLSIDSPDDLKNVEKYLKS